MKQVGGSRVRARPLIRNEMVGGALIKVSKVESARCMGRNMKPRGRGGRNPVDEEMWLTSVMRTLHL